VTAIRARVHKRDIDTAHVGTLPRGTVDGHDVPQVRFLPHELSLTLHAPRRIRREHGQSVLRHGVATFVGDGIIPKPAVIIYPLSPNRNTCMYSYKDIRARSHTHKHLP